MHEIIVDNFAGGGGASTGIEMATGRSVDIAINHDPSAIAMHTANHPSTEHYCESVWDVDPREVARGRSVGICWLSPDCKHFSKAKGGTPVNKNIRGLAWVTLRWAATVRPRIIMLENVEEFKTWGPLIKTEDGYYPDPKRKGHTFTSFVNALRRQGYDVEWRELKACDYGAPTIRKRLFLVARCDGKKIVWPEPTHGSPDSLAVKAGKLKPWRTAAEIIDWSIPCPSIFERKKPLAENTLRRIARGIERYVINNQKPYILKANEDGVLAPYITRIGQTGFGGDRLSYSLKDQLTTVTTKAEHLLVSPTLIQMGYGERDGQEPRVLDLDKPMGTVTAGGNKFAIAAASLIKHYGGGYTGSGNGIDEPLSTVTTVDHNALVTSHLMILRNNQIGQNVTDPIPTITAGGGHISEVRDFLIAYYGSSVGQDINDPLSTIVTKDRFGLVTVEGVDYQIVDIGMRMLRAHELFAGQGFPSNYIIDKYQDGKPVPQSEQVNRCGNSVSPVMSEALTRANAPELCTGSGKTLTFERYTKMAAGQLALSI